MNQNLKGLEHHDPERAKEREAEKKKIEAEQDRIDGIITRTFSTADGKFTLQMIARKCGFRDTSLTIDGSGRYCPELSIFKEAYRTFYLDLCRHLPAKLVNEVESELDHTQFKGLL